MKPWEGRADFRSILHIDRESSQSHAQIWRGAKPSPIRRPSEWLNSVDFHAPSKERL